ncbi:MAG: hypothetical protein AAB368_07375 [bacterium]
MPPGRADANISFTLTDEGRTRLIRVLDRITEGLHRASAVLTDTSGRIVDIIKRPVGIDLENLAALAAGCNATTKALAASMGEKETTLVFEHEDEQRVCIWPVLERALLVVMVRDKLSVETLEQRLMGSLGQELTAVVLGARSPLLKTPPPRVILTAVPVDVRSRVRALTSLIMNLQDRRPAAFTPDVNTRLLKSREELMKALQFENWPRAAALCLATAAWLNASMPPE